MSEVAPVSASVAMQDPVYVAAVVDFLGVIAYGEISAFDRLAEDARMAPCLEDRAALAGMAATEFGHFRKVSDRIRQLGADPMEAMSGFVEALDGFHERTAPSDWWEGLIKAYVGEGLVADFYREYIRTNRFARYQGTDANAVIQLKEQLTKKPGDALTISLVKALGGAGVTGNTLLEGQEEQYLLPMALAS